jgi:hypothetical protein
MLVAPLEVGADQEADEEAPDCVDDEYCLADHLVIGGEACLNSLASEGSEGTSSENE